MSDRSDEIEKMLCGEISGRCADEYSHRCLSSDILKRGAYLSYFPVAASRDEVQTVRIIFAGGKGSAKAVRLSGRDSDGVIAHPGAIASYAARLGADSVAVCISSPSGFGEERALEACSAAWDALGDMLVDFVLIENGKPRSLIKTAN